MQIGTGEGGRVLFLGLDVVFIAVVTFLLIKAINNEKGMRFLFIFCGILMVLVITSVLPMQGAHLFVQVLALLTIISLPVLFHQEWIGLLEGQNTIKPVLSSVAAVLWSILIASFITVIGIGITVKTGRVPVEIPVTAVNVGTGLSANLGIQSTVRVIVSANRNTWKSLNENAFSATVDLSGQKEGTIDLTVNVTSKISNVNIRKIEPSRIVTTVEPVIVKSVPVVVKFSGKAGEELVPDTPTITPDKVEISGAKSVVTMITQAIASFPLNGETKHAEQKITLSAKDATGESISGLTFKPSEVTVGVDLVKAGKIKTVGILPVFTGVPALGLWVRSVSTSPSAVSVTGPADILDKLTSISTEPYNINNLNEDTTIQVVLALPNGITIADLTGKISLKIDIEATSTSKTITPELIYANLGGAFKVTTVIPTSVSAIVTGSTAQLASIDGQVKINLDLSAYKSAGTYSLTITNAMFTLPNGVGLVSFLPSAITVTIESK